MAKQPKTQKTKASVVQFIAAVDDEVRRKDAKTIDKLMREITGEKPAMWGPSIIGYGEYQTRSGPWPRAGFSPRKANLVLYVMPGFKGYESLLKKLGRHKTGKSCLYLGKLADVDESALSELIRRSWDYMAETYPE